MITFVSSNINKANEIKQIIPDLNVRAVELVEIQGTLEEIVLYKWNQAKYLEHALVEDTGLFIEGFECLGPYVKYIKDFTPFIGRRATFKCAACLDGQISIGSVDGIIVDKRGDGGFGFDPWFEVNGKTLAECKSVNPRKMAIINLLSK